LNSIMTVSTIFFIVILFSTGAAFAVENKTNNTTSNYAAGSSVSFTSVEITSASSSVKSYVEKYKKLPGHVTINNVQVTMPQFLYLMTQNVVNINNGKRPSITLDTAVTGSTGTETVKTGDIYKSEYINIAKSIKSHIHTYDKAPSYITTSRGRIKYETMVYTLSKILSFQKTNNRLPNYVTLVPWSTVTLKIFTSAQINSASSSVKKYIEKYKKLPSHITINYIPVTMPQFLKLMTQNLINIKKGTVKSITLKSVGTPLYKEPETVSSGKINKYEYLNLANTVNLYIAKYLKPPNHINTSMGRINFETMVYTFSKTLFYNYKFKYLPSFVSFTPWNNLSGKNFSLRPVYITCDLISNTITDTARNNALASSLRQIGVKATNYGVKNSVWKLLEDDSVPSNTLIIEILGGADAAYIKEKGSTWYQSALGNKEIFLVFTDCAKDITNLAWLERAHDDNYSPPSFTGIARPDLCLLSHGVGYFEPLTTTNYDKCAQSIYAAASDM